MTAIEIELFGPIIEEELWLVEVKFYSTLSLNRVTTKVSYFFRKAAITNNSTLR